LALIAGLLVLGLVSSTGSLYAVPNAVGSTLSYSNPAELAQASPGTYYLSAVIPGIFEEFLSFSIITFMTLILSAITALIRGDASLMEEGAVVWFWRTVLCLTDGFYFSYAHAQYIGDGAMSAWAVIFEFSVQMLNQAGGVFVSWIPHVMHNSAVIATKTLSIAPFSIAALGLVWFWPNKVSHE
jgi:hypothetical protein